jgi:hypothetical protein
MAEGRIVTNDQGQQAWWDGQKLTPIRIEPGANVQPADIGAAVQGSVAATPPPGNLPPPPGLEKVDQRMDAQKQHISNEVARMGVQPPPEAGALPPPQAVNAPRFPGVEKVLQAAAGPVATGLAGLATGGASIPIQMGLGAATEAAGEKLGGEQLSPLKIGGAALLPPAVRGVGQGLKAAGRGVAKVIGKQNLVEGAVEKTESLLGKKGAEQAVTGAKNAAMRQTAEVVQTETGQVASDILSKRGRVSGVDPQVFRDISTHVRNAHKAYKAGEPIKYNELFESAINFNKKASKATGHDKDAYIRMREAMNKDLAALGPEADQFYQAYRKKASIGDISEALRKPNPTKAVSDILADPMLKDVFDKGQEETVKTIAKHIGPAGLAKISGSLASLGILGYHAPVTAGASILGPAVIGALVSARKVGPVMARSLVGPEGKVSAAAMPALAQMVRGYLAEQGEEGK